MISSFEWLDDALVHLLRQIVVVVWPPDQVSFDIFFWVEIFWYKVGYANGRSMLERINVVQALCLDELQVFLAIIILLIRSSLKM